MDRVRGDEGVEVTSIELDSRAVSPGSLFCCLAGEHDDGHRHVREALRRGACAVLVERPIDEPVTQVVARSGQARHTMALLSCALHGHPADSIRTVGVTGTNGKTTVVRLLRDVLVDAGRPCVAIGTLEGTRTTPEAPRLQRSLAEARDRGDAAAVMEVSSHALVQSRVDGFRFDVAVFTNLSQDHLDYHETIESYFSAKAALFTAEHSRRAVVDVDGPWGRKLLEVASVPVRPLRGSEATAVVAGTRTTSFTWRGWPVELSLTGRHQVANALAAATAAAELGLDEQQIARGLSNASPVPGRFEVLDTGAPFHPVVDYAHTPDALATALRAARELAGSGRVVCVFGSGGERDREKRPQMGEVAAGGADLVILTTDNPRGEDPRSIIAEIQAGIGQAAPVVVQEDRRQAIEAAVAAARSGDVVLVAGKGHETTMERDGRCEPFDDRVEVAAAVRRLLVTGRAESGPRTGAHSGGATP